MQTSRTSTKGGREEGDGGREGRRGGDGKEVHSTQSAETVLLLAGRLAGWLAGY